MGDDEREREEPSFLPLARPAGNGIAEQRDRNESGRVPTERVLPRSVNMDLVQHIITVFTMFNEFPMLNESTSGYCTIAYFLAGGNLPYKPLEPQTTTDMEGSAEKIKEFIDLIKGGAIEIFGDKDAPKDAENQG